MLRNTALEERLVEEKDVSLRELHDLRHDVLDLVVDDAERDAIDARFAAAHFPFRHDRVIPRITAIGAVEGVGLDPGLRTQQRWPDKAKRLLIRTGWEAADRELGAIEVGDEPPAYTDRSGT